MIKINDKDNYDNYDMTCPTNELMESMNKQNVQIVRMNYGTEIIHHRGEWRTVKDNYRIWDGEVLEVYTKDKNPEYWL